MKRIALIAHDSLLMKALSDNLTSDGYEVATAVDGEAGLAQVLCRPTDAIVLDLMLPGREAFDLFRRLRTYAATTPIVILSARSPDGDKILGLDLGAEDYLTEPFSGRDLLTRVDVVLNRSQTQLQDGETYRFKDVEIQFSRQQLRKGRRLMALSFLECEVLRYFVARKGQSVARNDLLMAVWGYRAFRPTRVVDNLVGRLRQKIEDRPHEPRHILTAHRVGYRFVD
jgi:DNA-binding response OmpR family regulator